MFRMVLPLVLPVALLASQGDPVPPKEPGRQKKVLKQEQLFTRLHRFRMERLQRALGISGDEARAIADRWARFDRETLACRLSLRRLHQQTGVMLLSPISEDEKNGQARPLIEQFIALRQQQYDLRRAFENEVRATLTPAQQARFILVTEEMQRSLLAAIRKHRIEEGDSIPE